MGKLLVLATPLGNLKDITLRGLEELKSADGIIAEDSRVTTKLLAHWQIVKPIFVFHQHSQDWAVEKIATLLREGKNLVLVTDAGTPAVADPGGWLISELLKRLGEELIISPLPGPNAAIAALSVSGFSADHFLFLGFPPHKKGRNKFFEKLAATDCTVVFYESPHRILKTLKFFQEHGQLKDRPLVVARELTKKFETIYRGTAAEILIKNRSKLEQGEITVVVRIKERC